MRGPVASWAPFVERTIPPRAEPKKKRITIPQSAA